MMSCVVSIVMRLDNDLIYKYVTLICSIMLSYEKSTNKETHKNGPWLRRISFSDDEALSHRLSAAVTMSETSLAE